MSAPQPASAPAAAITAGPVESSRSRSRRKQLGQWFTPEALVEHVVAMTLDGFVPQSDSPVVVVDPSCGDGRFLAAADRALHARGITARLIGVDIDATAAGAARGALPHAEIHQGDALTREWGGLRVDVVVGNPPFLNQLATSTTRGGRSRFGGGPYADTAAEFLALSVNLVRAGGGRVGLVLPQSVLSTRDAAAIRSSVASRAALIGAWWSTTRMFDAAVHTCALAFERGAVHQPVARWAGPDFAPRPAVTLRGSWAELLVDDPAPDAHEQRSTDGTVGDRMRFSVDFRDQYYGLVGAVGEDRDGVDGPPLVTCGLIEPGRCLWGGRSVRFAKQRYDAPRVDLDLLDPRMRAWAASRLVPKLLVANQTTTIEVVVDAAGKWLPSVPVISGVIHDGVTASLDEVAAVLSSPASSAWVRSRAAGSGLSRTSLRLTPALLSSIPWPAAG